MRANFRFVGKPEGMADAIGSPGITSAEDHGDNPAVWVWLTELRHARHDRKALELGCVVGPCDAITKGYQ